MDHVLYECSPGCDDEFCVYCRGCLAYCTVCGGAESSLPSECPGRKMDTTEQDAVMNFKLDFVNDSWIWR